MEPADWSKLLCLVGRRRRLSEWKSFFGDDFRLFEACLLRTGDHVRAVECSLCSCNHEVIPDKDGDGFVAHCRCDDRGCEDVPLTRLAAEAWELSGRLLGETLGRALGFPPGVGVRDGQSGLLDLGECPRHPRHGHVWLQAGSKRVLSGKFAAISQRKGVGCVVAAEASSALQALAEGTGIPIVPVAKAFTCAKGAIRGDCQVRCKDGAGTPGAQAAAPSQLVASPSTIDAIHAAVQRIEESTSPLPEAIAKVSANVDTVHKHVRGVPIIQSELADAQLVPESLAVEIQSRIADILTPEEQVIWRAMRKAGGSQKAALPSLRESGFVRSAATLSRRVKAINPKLQANRLPPCDAAVPAATFTKHGGYTGKDGDEVPEQLSAVEHDWAKDPVECDRTIQAYLSAGPEDREYFHQTKPGIQKEADRYLKRHRRN